MYFFLKLLLLSSNVFYYQIGLGPFVRVLGNFFILFVFLSYILTTIPLPISPPAPPISPVGYFVFIFVFAMRQQKHRPLLHIIP